MKHNPTLGDIESLCFALKCVFGTRDKVVKSMYCDDNSGPGTQPYAGSTTPPERRARYLQSKTARDYLAGPNGVKLGILYKELLVHNLAQNHLIKAVIWRKCTDLWDFSYEMMFSAATEIILGKRILETNPSLASEVRDFLEDLPTFPGMWPRWLAPAAHRRRDAALLSIKKWLREVERHSVDHAEWNPDHGCDCVRERHRFLSKFEEVDFGAEAAETIGPFLA